MLTLTALLESGSQQVGVTSTASIFSAAAERKSAPMLVVSATSSRIAILLAPLILKNYYPKQAEHIDAKKYLGVFFYLFS